MVCLTHGHGYVAFHVVVDYARDRARVFGTQRFVLERVYAALDERNFALDVYILIVGALAVPGHGNVIEHARAAIAERRGGVFIQLAHEIVFLARYRAGFVEEHYKLVVRHEELALDAAYGRHGQRGAVRGRRTDGCRIGVCHLVGVALLAAERRAVTVARRGEYAHAAVVDFVVNLVDTVAVLLARKTARRAERHVDTIHAQEHCVLQGGEYVVRLCAVVEVGEHLHQNELRIDGDARYDGVLTADNARHVRAVLGIVRENVVVLVGVIVRKRNFVAVPNVGEFEPRRGLNRVGVLQFGRDVVALQPQIAFFELVRIEHGVTAIEARVQNGNRRALARVAYAARVEYARIVNVDRVYYAAGRIARRRGAVVRVRKYNLVYARKLLDCVDVAVLGVNGNAVHNGDVAVFHARNKLIAFKLFYERVLARRDIRGLRPARRARSVIAHGLIGGPAEIVVDYGGLRQRNDSDYVVVLVVPAVGFEILRFNLRQLLLLREFKVAL